jgi:hypothetical protein
MRRAWLLALVLALPAASATAESVRIFGSGNDTCGAYLKAHQPSRSTVGFSEDNWIMGYVAAFETSELNGSHHLAIAMDQDPDALVAWITNYCREHPLDPIYEASDSLVAELIARAQRKK